MEKKLIMSEGLQTFIERNRQRSKVARLLYHAVNNHPMIVNGCAIEKYNFLDIREGEMSISYSPNGKEPELTQRGKWARAGRQDSRPAKLTRELLGKWANRLTNEGNGINPFEWFTTLLQGEFSTIGEVYTATGCQIAEIYEQIEIDRRADDSASACSSCMTGKEAHSLLQLYSDNPDRVSLLYTTDDNGRITSRALLWIADCKTRILDRVYGIDAKLQARLLRYAFDNGLADVGKQYNNHHSQRNMVDANGNTFEKVFFVTLNDSDCENFPYIDTFHKSNDNEDGNSTFTNDKGEAYRYTYNCTDGSRTDAGKYLHHSGTYWMSDRVVYDGKNYDQNECHYFGGLLNQWIPVEFTDAATCYNVAGDWITEDDAQLFVVYPENNSSRPILAYKGKLYDLTRLRAADMRMYFVHAERKYCFSPA